MQSHKTLVWSNWLANLTQVHSLSEDGSIIFCSSWKLWEKILGEIRMILNVAFIFFLRLYNRFSYIIRKMHVEHGYEKEFDKNYPTPWFVSFSVSDFVVVSLLRLNSVIKNIHCKLIEILECISETIISKIEIRRQITITRNFSTTEMLIISCYAIPSFGKPI